jgi:hypothetical protein
MRVPTGGTAPKGFMTCVGPRPALAELGLVARGTYASRTWRNVLDSDATLIVATKPNSPGTRLTISACVESERPYYVCTAVNSDTAALVVEWLKHHQVRVLNIAGNRDHAGQLTHVTLAQQLVLDVLQQLAAAGLLQRSQP